MRCPINGNGTPQYSIVAIVRRTHTTPPASHDPRWVRWRRSARLWQWGWLATEAELEETARALGRPACERARLRRHDVSHGSNRERCTENHIPSTRSICANVRSSGRKLACCGKNIASARDCLYKIFLAAPYDMTRTSTGDATFRAIVFVALNDWPAIFGC